MTIIEEIKERLDIVALIEEYVPLKKSGHNFAALCPFHSEKTPSFFVFPDTQRWQCFGGCGIGGDVLDFIQRRINLDKGEAIKFLADKAGIEIKQDSRLTRQREIMTLAVSYYHENLRQKAGRAAFDYTQARSIAIDTIKAYKLGYALNEWQALTLPGVTQDELFELGLLAKRKDGTYYDRFRNRLMIPIYDQAGHPIAFGARALDKKDTPKYLNSPTMPLFNKQNTLFGLHVAKKAIKESGIAVVVEGYLDALQAQQAGYLNVVAQLGTAFSDQQARQLAKYASKVVICLDPDSAGQKATLRDLGIASQMALADKALIELSVMVMPAGQDPDDLIRADPAKWQTLLDQAIPAADYVIGLAKLPDTASLLERERAAKAILPILLATEHDLRKKDNLQKLALAFHLDPHILASWSSGKSEQPKGKAPQEQYSPLEHTLLAYLLCHLDQVATLQAQAQEWGVRWISEADFQRPECKKAYKDLVAALNSGLIPPGNERLLAFDTTGVDPLNCLYRLRKLTLERENRDRQGQLDALYLQNAQEIATISYLLVSERVV